MHRYAKYQLLADCFHCKAIVDELGQFVNNVALSYDEGCVLAGCLDSTIRLLDMFALSSTTKLYVLLATTCFVSV